MNIAEIYKAAHANSHEAGLQAVWDAAVATVRAEFAALGKDLQEIVALPEQPLPDPTTAPVATTDGATLTQAYPADGGERFTAVQ